MTEIEAQPLKPFLLLEGAQNTVLFYKSSSPRCLNIQPATNKGGIDKRKEKGNMNVREVKVGVCVCACMHSHARERQRNKEERREKQYIDGGIKLFDSLDLRGYHQLL